MADVISRVSQSSIVRLKRDFKAFQSVFLDSLTMRIDDNRCKPETTDGGGLNVSAVETQMRVYENARADHNGSITDLS